MISDDNVVHSCWALAEETLHTNNYKDAIFYLEAICNSKDIKMSPQQEVRTRLRVGMN